MPNTVYAYSNAYSQKRQREKNSAAKFVFHSILIIIAVLLLLLGITRTAFVRHQLKYNRLTNALRSDTQISAVKSGGKTVAEIIREEFVSDDQVTLEDVADAVDCMEIPAFAADKLHVWGELLRGNSDVVPHITSDEVVGLLEEHEHDLYRKCMLVIDDSDKEDIRLNADGPLGIVNKLFDFFYGSPAMRALARFRVSIWCIILDIVLIGLLLWRWCRICKNTGRPERKAWKCLGFTVLIPGAVCFIACAVSALISVFSKNDSALGAVKRAVRLPMWAISMVTISAGALLIIFALLSEIIAHKRENAPAKTAPAAPAYPAAAPAAKAPAPQPEPAVRTCIHCGREFPAKGSFCIYCGKPQEQQPAEPAAEAPEVKAPPLADTAEIPAQAPAASAPSVMPGFTAPQIPQTPAAPAAEDPAEQ